MTSATRAAGTLLLVAAGLALLFAVLMQAHVASRMPLWGDETDNIQPAFLPWRGGHSFWWQIGQFNAQAPGENAVDRLVYRSGALEWLRLRSPELFWRLPYITVYAASAAAAMAGAWLLSGSAAVGFAALCATLSSSELFEYGTMVRFYGWAVFFVTALTWMFLALVERRRSSFSWHYYAFSLVCAAGVCFHLVVAGIGYFFLAYAILLLALDALGSPPKPWARVLARAPTALVRLFFGFLPFIMYKVELKHWVFIPPPWHKDVKPWAVLWEKGLNAAFLNLEAQNLPYGLSSTTIWALLAGLCACAAWSLVRGRWRTSVQAVFLVFLLVACPIAIFLSAAPITGELISRHVLFTAPVVIAAAVFLWSQTVGRLLAHANQVPLLAAVKAVAGVVVAGLFFVDTLPRLASFAEARDGTSGGRVTYQFVRWREAYRALPDRRQLVIVGSAPDNTGPMSDQEEFRAGIMRFYTDEFSPFFYSVKGGFRGPDQPDAAVLREVERNPGHYDLLVLDDPTRARALFPKLPWKAVQCSTYRPGIPLTFCR